MIDLICEVINVYCSCFCVVVEDFDNIWKNVFKFIGKIVVLNIIIVGYYVLIMMKDICIVKDVFNNINIVDVLFKGYFDYVCNNMWFYVDSVFNLFDSMIKEVCGFV